MIKSLLFCLIGCQAALFSAGPMFHLLVAERFCEINEITDPDVAQAIIIGSEFPDIRYITHSARDLTHPEISDIREVSLCRVPFEAGMKLHAWLDIVRERHISQEVYREIAIHAEGHPATLLKFVEEEMLADFYDGRRWSCCFDNILSGELSFASEDEVQKWHNIIQWTMSLRPSWYLWAQSYRGPAFGVSAATLYNWSYLLPELKQKPIFQEHLRSLLDHVEREMQKSRELKTQ